MKQFGLSLALAGAFVLGGLAAPAWARVDDRPNAISGPVERDLERDLARLGNHRFDVVFVDRPTGTPGRMARDEFRRRNLSARDGLILVAVKSKQVGVHLGQGFEDRGVGSSVIQEQIRARFVPAARRGDFASAARELAQGLVAASGTGTAGANNRVSRTQGAPAPRERSGGGGGFPWGLLVVVAIAGGGIWYYVNRQKSANVETRLNALRESQETIMSGVLKLSEVDQLARFQEGEAAVAYQTLARRSQKLLNKARKFGDRFHDAEKAVEAKKFSDAAPLLDALEQEVTVLESSITAAVSALEQMESGVVPSAEALAQVDLSAQVEGVAHELQELKQVYENERTRAQRLSVGNDPQVEGRLATARRHLTEAPINVKAAKKALREAEEGIERYRERIEAEADREVERESYQNQNRGGGGDFVTGAMIGSMLNSGHHHDHEERADWGGVTEEASWDSGSTGEGSWDSGGSSDDNSGSW